jgi:GNAT superfamily N-acetyltransferase
MIRRAETDADLAGWCEVWTAITPREPISVEEVMERLARQPERLYVVAEQDRRIVGLGFAGPSDSPGRLALAVRVLPEARRCGLGSQLYEQVLNHAIAQKPDWVSGLVSGADPEALGWATRRGFEEYGRDVELVRELRGDETFPAAPAGLAIVEVTPDLREAAYALTREAWQDLPTGFAVKTPDFDEWLAEDLVGPIAFAALDDGEVVGFAALMARDAPGLLEHGLTATRRTHRRRRIATALKQTQIAWAAANGYRELITFTQEGNEGMQAINLALGYKPQPPWIRVRRRP